MDLKQLVVLALRISIFCTVFGFGLKATSRDLSYLFRRPDLLLRSLLAVLVIMPFVAIVLAQTFDFPRATEIALIALAISPVPPLLPKKALKVGGQSPYALALMMTLALLAILTVPLSVEILELAFGRQVGVTPGAIARVVLTSAVAPLILGVVVRRLLPGLSDRIAKTVTVVAMVLLPLAIVALLAATWRAVWAVAGDGTLLAMVVFVAIGLLVGHLLGGPEPENSVALALSSACRHPAIALTIASTNFPGERFAGTILLYLIVSAVVSTAYVVWRRKLSVAAAT